jgi:hypothetical protein
VVVNGKRRELGLGSYPDLPLAKAKEEAATYRLLARRGQDPAAERDKLHAAPLTFEQAARIGRRRTATVPGKFTRDTAADREAANRGASNTPAA